MVAHVPFSVEPDSRDEDELVPVPRDRRTVGEVDVVARGVEEATRRLALHVRRERVNQTRRDVTAHLLAYIVVRLVATGRIAAARSRIMLIHLHMLIAQV